MAWRSTAPGHSICPEEPVYLPVGLCREGPAQAGVLLALALEEAHIQGLGAGAFRLHRR